MFKTTAQAAKSWEYDIPCRCQHCGSTNYVSNRTNSWKCWHCGYSLEP